MLEIKPIIKLRRTRRGLMEKKVGLLREMEPEEFARSLEAAKTCLQKAEILTKTRILKGEAIETIR